MDVFDSVEFALLEHNDGSNNDDNRRESTLGRTSRISEQFSTQRETSSSLREGKLFIELIDVSGIHSSG